MTIQTLLIHEVDILKPTMVTSNAGDESFSWDNPTRTASQAWIDPEKVFEPGDPLRPGSELQVQIFFSPTAVVANEDRIDWDGRIFHVIGPPRLRFTPRGVHHLEVKAVEYDG